MGPVVIGCDIGGVVRDLVTEEAIRDSIETLEGLDKLNFKIIFISQCKESYKSFCQRWLAAHGLNIYECFYCAHFSEKNEIALQNNVAVMVDDHMGVLDSLDEGIFKIWFCDDSKRIGDVKQCQPMDFASVQLARDWKQVDELIRKRFC